MLDGLDERVSRTSCCAIGPDGRIKLLLTSRLLRFRRDHPDLFLKSSYVPLTTSGAHAESCIAFAREHGVAMDRRDRAAAVVARRFSADWASFGRTPRSSCRKRPQPAARRSFSPAASCGWTAARCSCPKRWLSCRSPSTRTRVAGGSHVRRWRARVRPDVRSTSIRIARASATTEALEEPATQPRKR